MKKPIENPWPYVVPLLLGLPILIYLVFAIFKEEGGVLACMFLMAPIAFIFSACSILYDAYFADDD